MIAACKILFVVQIICLGMVPAFSQQFRYTAPLGTVDTTGFYAITILPRHTALIKTNFADIRISDNNKQWVPHILRSANSTFSENLFTALPILKNTVTDSGKNLLMIENTNAAGIYSLDIFLKNASVSRTAVLSGSNNLLNWFIIDDSIAIGRSYEMAEDEYRQEINFPLAKYRYLKVLIDNAHNDPLLITKTGFYAQRYYAKSISYLDNPAPLVVQKDHNNYSDIEVIQESDYPFDKITMRISGSKFYSRQAQIFLPVLAKSSRPIPGKVIGEFALMSALPAVFELPRIKTAVFFIRIKNADNPPLKIENVLIQQRPVTLVAYLERGKKYELLLGDSLAAFAEYDLQVFKDSITGIRPLAYGNLHPVGNSGINKRDTGKNRWIWPSIILAGIILSFLTYRLTADINKAKKIES